MFKIPKEVPIPKALLGENVHSVFLSSTTHQQQSNEVKSWKKILVFEKKKLKDTPKIRSKSNNAFECSPLSNATFTDQKPPKKLRRTIFSTDFWKEVAVLSL